MTLHIHIRTGPRTCPHLTQKLTSFVLINSHFPSYVYSPSNWFELLERPKQRKGRLSEPLQSNYLLSDCENAEWSWYQMVDGGEAIWSCSLSVTLPSLAWVSARNMSSKSWSASTSSSTPLCTNYVCHKNIFFSKRLLVNVIWSKLNFNF